MKREGTRCVTVYESRPLIRALDGMMYSRAGRAADKEAGWHRAGQ